MCCLVCTGVAYLYVDCGAISHYNEQGGYSKVMDILPLCVFKVTIMTLSTRPVGHQCPTLGQGRFLTLLG